MNDAPYEIETLERVIDRETNVATELFESIPNDGYARQDRPYGVRVVDLDVGEACPTILRFADYNDAYDAYVTAWGGPVVKVSRTGDREYETV